MFPMAQQPRLYDPSDPTAFPVHAHPTTLVTSSNIVLNPPLPPLAYTQPLRPGKYLGLHRSEIWAYLPLCHLNEARNGAFHTC
ncbi:hypothetical protein BDR04DRAFT_4809 [Suillus decipiens]|nr:hypothetical protein BDR04DRAFT_4809 [Suillus decipiens]